MAGANELVNMALKLSEATTRGNLWVAGVSGALPPSEMDYRK
jgi:hypothetical protein